MSSRSHSSEDALAVVGCDRARTIARPRVLMAGGVLAVWSARAERRFERRLRAGGFRVETDRARRRLKKRLGHTILIARNESTSTRQPAFAIPGTSRPATQKNDHLKAGAPARSLPASIVRSRASTST